MNWRTSQQRCSSYIRALKERKIADLVRSVKTTVRNCVMEKNDLLEIKKKVERHIKNDYLRRMNAPAGVKPELLCWMEIN